MAGKNINNYFDMFVEMVEYSCKSAEILNDTLNNFDPNTLEMKMTELHHIEHSGDTKKHEMISKLMREFITPIERDDIIGLAQEIDDVTDAVEDVLMKIYMYNIKTIRPEAKEFSKLIVRCCNAMKKAAEDFRNFKKSTTIHDILVEINRLEEVGDKLYTQAVRDLYVGTTDPIEIMAWTEAFARFEKCCDACEDVADVIERVIMKNS